MTIWYPATAAKEDSGDDMNNDTQYPNNAPTTPYKTRTTHYQDTLVNFSAHKKREAYEETKAGELIRSDSKDNNNDCSECY
jgi:hypothetical protein